jgi:hypothetical protein
MWSLFLFPLLITGLLEVNLPKLMQPNKTILAVINAAFPSRSSHYIYEQVHSYLQFCESGYEIHIVIISLSSSPSALTNAPKLYCSRLKANLVIVEDRVQCNLAARHRHIMSNYSKAYDYFICQEDDLLITVNHMAYFVKGVTMFRGTAYYPGLMVKEYAIDRDGFQEAYWMNFIVTRKFRLVNYHGSDLILHDKAWVPLFFLNRDMLLNISSYPEWVTDEWQEWPEFNVHFMHFFLVPHFKIAIPVSDLEHAYVHHQPDRYIHMILKGPKTNIPNSHQYIVTAIELNLALHQLLGHSSNTHGHSGWNVTLDVDTTAKDSLSTSIVRHCIDSAGEVQVDMHFMGDFDVISQTHQVQVYAHGNCIQHPDPMAKSHQRRFIPNDPLETLRIEINRCPKNRTS